MPVADQGANPEEAVQVLISELKTHELSSPQLRQSLTSAMSGSKKVRVSESTLTAAFSSWLDEVGSTHDLLFTTAELHEYRQFMSHFAPAIFVKTATGQVAFDMSAIEAVYLLDKVMSHAGLPSLGQEKAYARPSLAKTVNPAARAAYQDALSAYREHKPVDQRASACLRILAGMAIR